MKRSVVRQLADLHHGKWCTYCSLPKRAQKMGNRPGLYFSSARESRVCTWVRVIMDTLGQCLPIPECRNHIASLLPISVAIKLSTTHPLVSTLQKGDSSTWLNWSETSHTNTKECAPQFPTDIGWKGSNNCTTAAEPREINIKVTPENL